MCKNSNFGIWSCLCEFGIRDFQKWLPSNQWRHCWGTEQTGTNDVTEFQAENHL